MLEPGSPRSLVVGTYSGNHQLRCGQRGHWSPLTHDTDIRDFLERSVDDFPKLFIDIELRKTVRCWQ